MNIAAALQKGFEDAVLGRLEFLKARHGCENICLAGGSALNVVMTGKLARSGMFKQTYVFPASGDDGTSVGAAQYVHHVVLGRPPWCKRLRSMSLGPLYDEAAILQALHGFQEKVAFRREQHVEEAVAEALAQGKVVGWFHGRMEFGPRARQPEHPRRSTFGADARCRQPACQAARGVSAVRAGNACRSGG
jgi:carbamoyltransferase